MYSAIDTAGIFTDFVLSEKGENILTFRVPSTPDAPVSAVLTRLQRLRDWYEFYSASLDSILFGTTKVSIFRIPRCESQTGRDSTQIRAPDLRPVLGCVNLFRSDRS